MVILKIGRSERQFSNLGDIDKAWVNQELNELRRTDQPICIHVTINDPPVNIALATQATCAQGPGGMPRGLTQEESQVANLWAELGFNGRDFNERKLIQFFQQAGHIVH